MTPLIQKAVRLISEPESIMWFDVGLMDEWPRYSPTEMELILNLPFSKNAIVGVSSTGENFILYLAQGVDSVSCSISTIERANEFTVPLVYIKTDEGLRYYSEIKPVDKEYARLILGIVYATLMKLYGRKYEAYKPVVLDTPINRKRVAKGKRPIFDWHTVTIGPWASKAEPQGGTHASPRLHDRRGHWRTIKPSGKRVWVKPCKVGDASKGMVFKDYRVAQ